MNRDEMEQHLEDVLRVSHQQEQLNQPELDTGLPPSSPSRPESQQNAEIPDDENLGHMCIVLSPQIRKQLMRGEPLIVGTSTASVEAFFQRLISVCQMGAHMPVMFQTLGGAVTVANIKKRKTGIISKTRTDRYPVPPVTKRNRTKPAPETFTATSNRNATPSTEEPPSLDRMKKSNSDRDEIPLAAVRLYLTDKHYFPGWSANAKRNLRKRCKDFILDPTGPGILYKTKKHTVLPCIEDKAQRMSIIWEAHVMDHRRRDGLLNTLREKYYWKGMFQDVNKVLDSCEVCLQQKSQKSKEREVTADLLDDAQQLDEPALQKGRRDRARKSASFMDKPSTPEASDSEKYPETSEVPLADRPNE